MTKVYSWKSELSKKTNQEIFEIYIGFPKQFYKGKRYQAGRILEARDFKFDQIIMYKTKWELEKLQEFSTKNGLSIGAFFSHHRRLFISLVTASIVLIIFEIFQLFPPLNWTLIKNEAVLISLNIISLAGLLSIIGFVVYLSINLSKIRRKRRTLELSGLQENLSI